MIQRNVQLMLSELVPFLTTNQSLLLRVQQVVVANCRMAFLGEKQIRCSKKQIVGSTLRKLMNGHYKKTFVHCLDPSTKRSGGRVLYLQYTITPTALLLSPLLNSPPLYPFVCLFFT
jgi:hypothetical protein